jgi:3-oxoacyl-[acyl-carrier-protein] synthase II
VSETWGAALAGKSCVRALDADWCADLPTRIAAVVELDPFTVLDRVQARRMDRSGQLGVIAAREAWAHAGAPGVEPDRLGVSFGTGIGGLSTVVEQYDILNSRGPGRVNPLTVPMIMPNAAAALVGLDLGARAGVHAPVSACATSAEALALGAAMLRDKRADVVVAGGAEAVVNRLALASFGAMRALSTRNDEPELASRPYDVARDGFVLGEGAGALVLEREDDALARGAEVHAYLLEVGMTADSHHIAAPEPEGLGAAAAMRQAVERSDLTEADIVHVNAHATSTPLGDVAEARAIRLALGERADEVAVTAPKSMMGHLLGGAGAVESVLTVLALKEGLVPPTINLEKRDPSVELDVVTGAPRSLASPGKAALNNSFGFGGHNVTVLFAHAA